jgi:diguanylate cyclase (GGDEF)-like protein
LLKANGHLAGILLLANSVDARDFSNSDRKLSEVLAVEGAKLIRARRDALTDLFNREGLYEKIGPIIDRAKTSSQESSLLFLDIDQFKIVNEVSGQEAGDKLLVQFSGLIKKHLGEIAVMARLGADEFVVLLEDFSLESAHRKAESIRQAISQFRFVYENKIYGVTLSIGVVSISPEIENNSQILSAADMACGMAKEKGGNRVHVFHSSDQDLMLHENQMQWVSRINQALEDQRFILYRQKILSLTGDGEEGHYEVLLRLKDEGGNIVPPFEFIPAAERYGLMTKLDKWVIKNALEKMSAFYAGGHGKKLSCSINLSGQSLCELGFLEYIVNEVSRSGLAPETICFEVTETVAVSNLTEAIEFMHAVKKIGCKFSLDDFGSGMSSFTYLKNLPVDYLKIDGYFVKTMLENKIDYAMVESINQIGQVMGLKTIAEFVENDAIIDELKKIGVNYGQGYGINKPEVF